MRLACILTVEMGEFTGPALNAMNTNIKISGIGVWGRSTLHIQYTAVVIYSSRGGWIPWIIVPFAHTIRNMTLLPLPPYTE